MTTRSEIYEKAKKIIEITQELRRIKNKAFPTFSDSYRKELVDERISTKIDIIKLMSSIDGFNIANFKEFNVILKRPVDRSGQNRKLYHIQIYSEGKVIGSITTP